MKEFDRNRFYYLVLKVTEEDISVAEKAELEGILASDSQAARLYAELVCSLVYMQRKGHVDKAARGAMDSVIKNSLWQSLEAHKGDAFAGKSGYGVCKGHGVATRQGKSVSGSLFQRTSRRVRVIAALIPVAIALAILVWNFSGRNGTRYGVATLSSVMNARWSVNNAALESGSRLADSGEKIVMEQGLAELAFDRGVVAVLEAPISFTILSADQIFMDYGSVYARVSENAKGFAVSTKAGKVVDMGTEFGVKAGVDGTMQMQVNRGWTKLFVGNSETVGQEVTSGQARMVSGSKITSIAVDEKAYIQDFDVEKDIIWHQRPTINLTDVICGGNGQGAGTANFIIDPRKNGFKRLSFIFDKSPDYRVLDDNRFVDGVFVPDGRNRQVVSSCGHVFAECPPTSGVFDNQVVVNPKPGVYKTDIRTGDIVFNGRLYGYGQIPCMVLHANLGITIDLEAIRKSYNCGIEEFSCKVGIADLHEVIQGNVDFWILVDGKVRYSLKSYNRRSVLNDVLVGIGSEDRFLTLAATEGGDKDNPDGSFYQRAISCDWCVFAEPVLVLH